MSDLATPQISAATAADLPELVALLGVLFTQEADFTPDPARQERGLRMILAQPEAGRVNCLRAGGRVVGMVSLLFSISTAEGGRVAWLEDMVVHPDYRGQGLGEQLLRHALAEARSLGCTRVTLLTDGDNFAAMRFYQRAGFTRSGMVPMRLQGPRDADFHAGGRL